ncbi:Z1 domain-containing protein [Streptomyces californicus]|uniref:Z1 domain-containing protein n=1 Tax=Streptomyces californicus TaxID=67351 RepID=UPI0037A36E5C
MPLEGLTTSYCLRAPANYETLRLLTTPFGPHTGYQDLCRLYATLEVLDTQSRLTARINGQREELQELAGPDITPAQAVLRVRATHSPGRSWETLDFTLALEKGAAELPDPGGIHPQPRPSWHPRTHAPLPTGCA